VICVETIGKIRRWYKVELKSISEIARRLGASRNTIKKYLRSEVTRPVYKKRAKRLLALGHFASQLDAWLLDDSRKLARERRTGQRLFEGGSLCVSVSSGDMADTRGDRLSYRANGPAS
jgi:predicted transcriptional regulator